MSDKELYLLVIEELKTIRHKALWKKASALAKGDPKETRSKYIALRVEMLKDDGDISVNKDLESTLLKLVPKLITIVVITIVIVGLYYFTSPYQNCLRDLRAIKGNAIKIPGDRLSPYGKTMLKGDYCISITDW